MKLNRGRALVLLLAGSAVIIAIGLVLQWWLVPSVLSLGQLAGIVLVVVAVLNLVWVVAVWLFGSDVPPKRFWNHLRAWLGVEGGPQSGAASH